MIAKNPKEKKEISDEMIKWRRIGAIVGGAWGLICGSLYGWNALVTAFSPYDVLTPMFDNLFEITIFFPAFVTNKIIFEANEMLAGFIIHAIPLLSLLLWFFIAWSTKISRKICIGGCLLLLILTASPIFASFLLSPLSLGLLSIAIWFAVIPVLLSIVFGILIASLLFYLLFKSERLNR